MMSVRGTACAGPSWRLPTLAALLLSAACSSATVNTEFDRGADFSRYRSFSYRPGHPARNPLVDRRIVSALEDQLREKGLTRTDGTGDLVATYHLAVENEVDLTSTGSSIYGPRWGMTPTNTQVTNVPVGTLVVDLLDSAGTRLVWRGQAKETVGSDPEKVDKQVGESMARMFEQFPP
jgi:hypothetical protein